MPSRDPFAPGEVVAGRYEIGFKLGKGGFGTVFRARHRDLKKDVALKVLNPELAANELARERFLKEVEATTAFVHKFAVQLREFGHDEKKGVLYFTMDLVEGETLRSILERERLPEARAARLVAQVLEALEEAHGAGLVHRDLKPENLIVTKGRDGKDEVRVLDFGIAKAVAASRDSTGGLTATGTTLGTLFYMSPEQDEGKKLDGRSDLYSLGVILYECVSGERPIEPDPEAENQVQSFHFRLATVEPRPLAEAAPGVSAAFAAVTAKALAKKRDGRFANAREMRDALAALAGSPAGPDAGSTRTSTGLATGHAGVAPAQPAATSTGLGTNERSGPPPASPGEPTATGLPTDPAPPHLAPKTLTGLATGETPRPAPRPSGAGLVLAALLVLVGGGAAFALNLGGFRDAVVGTSVHHPAGPPGVASNARPPAPAPPPIAEQTERELERKEPEEDAWQGLLSTVDRAGSEDAKVDLVETWVNANGQNPHAGEARVLAERLGGSRRGWSGEKLPKGLRRGRAKPVYVYDTGKGLEIELVYVPAGEFVMGADDSDAYEKPTRTEKTDHGYWIGRTDVTWKQYLAFCDATGHAKPEAPAWSEIKEDHPVVNVSWDDLHETKAKEGRSGFLEWSGLALPTEKEWEKAARGTDGRKHPWGNEALTAERCVWNGHPTYGGKSTAPAGSCSKGASPYGALDMAGNVWQWCEDLYPGGGSIYPGGSIRASRGGSWLTVARNCRSSYRGWNASGRRADELGFRVALRSVPHAAGTTAPEIPPPGPRPAPAAKPDAKAASRDGVVEDGRYLIGYCRIDTPVNDRAAMRAVEERVLKLLSDALKARRVDPETALDAREACDPPEGIERALAWRVRWRD